jgi:predicted nuclease with TOPRIM domain
MLNLEQVKLLETKVARAIEYVEQTAGEKAQWLQREAALLRNEAELRAKLESCQKRIDELEVLVMRFKEDQSRIEDGILSALDRLSQFEDAVAQSLSAPKPDKARGGAAEKPEKSEKSEKSEKPAQPKAAAETGKSAPAREEKAPEKSAPKEAPKTPAPPPPGEIFFEISDDETDDDIEDPLGDVQGEDGELDIF